MTFDDEGVGVAGLRVVTIVEVVQEVAAMTRNRCCIPFPQMKCFGDRATVLTSSGGEGWEVCFLCAMIHLPRLRPLLANP